MTIGDLIRKFFFNLQMQHRIGFNGPELYTYVRTEMKTHSRKYIEDQSVLRCLRKLRDDRVIDYDSTDPNSSEYVIYPKRGLL